MKRLILFVFTVLSFVAVSAQQQDDAKLSVVEPVDVVSEEINTDNMGITENCAGNSYIYCYVRFGWGKKVYLDFDLPERKKYYIFGENGEKMKFDNELSAINFLSYIGWELVEVVDDASGSNGSTSTSHSYLIKKKVADLSPEETAFYRDYINRGRFRYMKIML